MPPDSNSHNNSDRQQQRVTKITSDDPNYQRLQEWIDNKMDPTLYQQPVLVTGCDGYVGGVLVRLLLQLGFTVHGTYYNDDNDNDNNNSSSNRNNKTISSMPKQHQLHYLLELPNAKQRLHLFPADLLVADNSFYQAMQGCGIVFHTASPFVMKHGLNVPKTLIEPAVQGTRHVLQTATATPTVRRVVLTSSIGAMYADAVETTRTTRTRTTIDDNDDHHMMNGINESAWNRSSTIQHQPYFLSKTMAEQAAWVLAGSQTQWTMVTMNPAMILGPGLIYHAQSESYKTICEKLSKAHFSTWFGVPDFAMPIVDVRDVAAAHVLAAAAAVNDTDETTKIKGRFILSATNSSIGQIAGLLRKHFPNYPLPLWSKSLVPKWVAFLATPLLRQGMDRWTVWYNLNTSVHVDNTKSRQVLQLQYRPLEETLCDMYQQLIDCGAVQPGPPPELYGAALLVMGLAIGVGVWIQYF